MWQLVVPKEVLKYIDEPWISGNNGCTKVFWGDEHDNLMKLGWLHKVEEPTPYDKWSKTRSKTPSPLTMQDAFNAGRDSLKNLLSEANDRHAVGVLADRIRKELER